MPGDIADIYAKARRSGEQAVRRAAGEGRYPYLPALADLLPDYETLSKIPVGVMEIPLPMITGTVTRGRQNAFAYNFMPILAPKTEFAAKWEQLFASQETEGIREPVKCYEYLKRFYILEGNKRVSVLNYVGAYSAEAEIWRIMPSKKGAGQGSRQADSSEGDRGRKDDPRVFRGTAAAAGDDNELQVYYEFLEFFKSTGLYEIDFSRKGSYARAAARYGMRLGERWPKEKIEEIRSDYRVFAAQFQKLGGKKVAMTAGDAFLIYQTIYPESQLIGDSRALIDQRIRNIWSELISAAGEEIAVVENPDPTARKKFSIPNIFNGGKPAYSKENPLRIAFIYPKDPEISRWIYGQELGRNELVQHFDGMVETRAFAGCDTGEKTDRAFAAAAADGAGVVFTTSPDMMEASMRAAVRYPDMKILNCSIHLMSSAVRTYYPKMYEAKFILGALAASSADDHRIGYVAAYPLNGNIANINAFAIGAGIVDPQARIYLSWMGRKGADWERELEQEQGLHVISGPDVIRPDNPTRKYGVYKIQPDGSVKNLAAPIWQWGKFYTAIVQTIVDGSWEERERTDRRKPINYWFGMPSGAVDVITSGGLSYYSEKLIRHLRRGMLAAVINPFEGEIHSQNRVIAKKGHPALSSKEIIEMNWLNDNIIGEIPGAGELIDSVQRTLQKSGIPGM